MKYEARKFNQESYDENDEYAKEKFKKFLIKKGYTIISDKENYNHDINAEYRGKQRLFELEIKRNYPFTNRESFSFSTVSFLGRKKRLHNMKNFIYVIICKETDWAISCESEKIFNEEYTEQLHINTSHRSGYDEFYRVPKNKCRFFNLND